MALTVYNKDIVEILALFLLQKNEMYAYSIMKQIGELSGSTIQVQGGTLYPILYKLEEKGFITERREVTGKRQRMIRIYYSITPLGREHLNELIEENNTVQLALRRVMLSADEGE